MDESVVIIFYQHHHKVTHVFIFIFPAIAMCTAAIFFLQYDCNNIAFSFCRGTKKKNIAGGTVALEKRWESRRTKIRPDAPLHPRKGNHRQPRNHLGVTRSAYTHTCEQTLWRLRRIRAAAIEFQHDFPGGWEEINLHVLGAEKNWKISPKRTTCPF